MNLSFPILKRSNRSREYKLYTEDQRSEIVYLYLFLSYSHRKLDEIVLKLEKLPSKGYQSMGVLHYLGLTEDHKGIFADFTLAQIINYIPANNVSDYKDVLKYLNLFYINHNYLFAPSEKPLLKQVGKSQFHDGIRINSDFFQLFNNEDSPNYVSRGQKRKIYLKFNSKIFIANYRYENQTDISIRLERIGFNKTIIDEFQKVYTNQNGIFEVVMGQDNCHFVVNSDTEMTLDAQESLSKKIIKNTLPKDESKIENSLLAKIKKNKKAKKSTKITTTKTTYRSDSLLKEQIKTLYAYKCQICCTQIKKTGWKPSFSIKKQYDFLSADIHHIIALNLGGNNDSSNMICVCPNCHRRLHSGEYDLFNNENKLYCLNTISGEKIFVTDKHGIQLKKNNNKTFYN